MPRLSIEFNGATIHCTQAQLKPTLEHIGCKGDPSVPGPESELVKSFLGKLQEVGQELGSQIAVTAATGIECSTGGEASRIAKQYDGPLGNRIRAET